MAGTTSEPLPRYRSNLQGEVDGAAVYAALADSEADPKLAEVFRRLAAVEQSHGEFWRKRIEAGGSRFTPSPSRRARILAWLARRFGPAFVLPALAASETRDSAAYDDQPEARAAGLPADERSHALLMQAAAGMNGLPGPTLGCSRDGIAAAGIRCGPRCSARMMVLSPISASSWASPVRPGWKEPCC